MIGRWTLPVVLGLVLGIVAYTVTLVETPRMLMAAAMRRLGAGGFDRMAFPPLATDASRSIVRPSPDLAYAACPYDLRWGPVAVHVAPVPSAYWSLAVYDARTTAVFVRNNAESAGGPIDVLIAQGWQKGPVGVPLVHVASPRGIALVRILVADRSRFSAIDAARRGSSCRTLAG